MTATWDGPKIVSKVINSGFLTDYKFIIIVSFLL